MLMGMLPDYQIQNDVKKCTIFLTRCPSICWIWSSGYDIMPHDGYAHYQNSLSKSTHVAAMINLISAKNVVRIMALVITSIAKVIALKLTLFSII